MNILAILAHHDDEALLCGGTLMRLRAHGHLVALCIATGYEYENPRDDPVEEELRQMNRITAYWQSRDLVCSRNLFFELSLRQKERIPRGTVEDMFHCWTTPPDLIITHGEDTGHATHATVRESVLAADLPCPVIHTAPSGPIRVAIDLPAKQKLLEFYRYGTTRTPEWRPADNPAYHPWCGEFEHFTADPGVVEWWGAQFPGFAVRG